MLKSSPCCQLELSSQVLVLILLLVGAGMVQVTVYADFYTSRLQSLTRE